MSKLTFGEYIGSSISQGGTIKVMKLGYAYFNTDAMVKAAEYIEVLTRGVVMLGEPIDPLQKLCIEILIAAAGFKSLQDAREHYQRYISRPDKQPDPV